MAAVSASRRREGAEQVQEISGNWESRELRRIAVVGADASSALTPEGEQYSASRAIDGRRGTKWVANVAPSSAAPQWITLELARPQTSLMTLGGCSISLSDDFRTLEPPRIRMMQQCLPPGNPPARPLDLFERERPSLWHMHCQNEAGEWDAVGVFNFEDQAVERTVEFSSLRIPADAEAAVFEFWEEKFLGTHRKRVTVSLAPHTARILLIHPLPTGPR